MVSPPSELYGKKIVLDTFISLLIYSIINHSSDVIIMVEFSVISEALQMIELRSAFHKALIDHP